MPCESWRHCSSRASVITTTVVALSPVAEFSAAESCDLESSMSILDVVWTTYILLRKVEIILSIPFGSETGAHSVGDGASGDDVDMAERKGLESTICLPIDDNDPPLPSRATLNVGGDAFCLLTKVVMARGALAMVDGEDEWRFMECGCLRNAERLTQWRVVMARMVGGT
ncbi:hypothetical protein LR48_Vigan583s001300 [Vigna angularis]|uniref:Uncharacterized protein n=1 Tax=Phaseolus angularis TaxID=3914 RepID=A0A0L9TE17_PHAAN|nr:hypothetical protein LR48_Vigan583s001300 [Vigna angularis]